MIIKDTVSHVDMTQLTTERITLSQDDMATELERVQYQKARVAERLSDLERERAMLEVEASELAITERTLAKLNKIDLPKIFSAPAPRDAHQTTRKKPRGIPTIYVMVLTLFRDRGDHLIEGAELVQAIKDRWWPTANNNDISPTLWRLHKTGKLIKKGTKYAVPVGILGAHRDATVIDPDEMNSAPPIGGAVRVPA